LTMNYLQAIALLCFASTCVAVSKPTWPPSFDSTFGITFFGDPHGSWAPVVNSTCHMYYSWPKLKATRLDYNNCLPLFAGATLSFCSLIFNPTGTYFANEDQSTCCLLFPGVGSVPPNFLAPFNDSGITQLAIDYYGLPHTTNLWLGEDNFQYWTDSTTGDDVQFVDAGSAVWWFAPFNVAPQPNTLFSLGSQCNTKCSFGKPAHSLIPFGNLHR